MTFGELLNEFSDQQKRTVRRIESTQKKIVNAKLAVVFNKECLKNNILPKFTNIHLDEAVQQRRFTLEFRRKLVVNQIEEKTKTVQELQEKLVSEQLSFNSLDVSGDLKRRAADALSEQLVHPQRVVESRIQKKLCNLYGGWLPVPRPTEGYVNLSDITLTEDQKELLNLGINFTFSPRFRRKRRKQN